MTTSLVASGFTAPPPDSADAYRRSVQIVQPLLVWRTPGTYIAEAAAFAPEVRFVAERLDGNSYSVVVVLDDDPEALLDKILGVEAALYEIFRGMAFDVRITKPPKDWDDSDLRASSIIRYARQVG